MVDKIIFILLYLVLGFSSMFIWMRWALEVKGQKFGLTNQSWNIYHAFLQRLTYDDDLKTKYKRFKIVRFIIILLLIVATILL